MLIFTTWCLQAVPLLITFLPAWYYRRWSFRFYWSDYLLIVLPWSLWGLTAGGPGVNKSLSNAVVEPLVLGLGLAVLVLVRVFFALRFRQPILSRVVLLLSLFLSLALSLFIPGLPE